MEKITYQIKLGQGERTVKGYEYRGFGLTAGDYQSPWKWEATMLNNGLAVASAPTRKMLIEKLDKVLELAPRFHAECKEGRTKQLEKKLPKGISLSSFGNWLKPRDGSAMDWGSFLDKYGVRKRATA